MIDSTDHNLDWQGPLGLLPSSADYYRDALAARKPGIYLWAFEYHNGYLIYGVGLTSQPLAKRIGQHIPNFRSGQYTVLNGLSAQRGVRDEFWHGMWEGFNSPARQAERVSRQAEIRHAADEMLGTMRVFLANLPPERRVLGRVESAIMQLLYSAASPICDLPDKGVHLEPRRPSEPPLIMHSNARVILHGLPSRFGA